MTRPSPSRTQPTTSPTSATSWAPLSETADTTLKKITESAGNADKALASATATLDEARAISRRSEDATASLNDTAGTMRDELPPLVSRLRTTLDNADPLIQVTIMRWVRPRTFDGADRIINTEIGPVAAGSAASRWARRTPPSTPGPTFPASSNMSAVPPPRPMTRSAACAAWSMARRRRRLYPGRLPQYTRLATLRNVADNVNELVSSLKRNPSWSCRGRKPRFPPLTSRLRR